MFKLIYMVTALIAGQPAPFATVDSPRHFDSREACMERGRDLPTDLEMEEITDKLEEVSPGATVREIEAGCVPVGRGA